MPSNFFPGKGCFLFHTSCNWKLQFYAENLKCRCHQAIGTSYIRLLQSGLLRVRHHQEVLMSTCSLAFIMVFRVVFFEAEVTRRLWSLFKSLWADVAHVEIMFGIFGYRIKFGFCFLLFLLPLPTLKPWLIQFSSVVLIMLPFTLANEAIQETCIPVSAHLQFTCRSSHMQKPGFQSSRHFRHTNRLDFFEWRSWIEVIT